MFYLHITTKLSEIGINYFNSDGAKRITGKACFQHLL